MMPVPSRRPLLRTISHRPPAPRPILSPARVVADRAAEARRAREQALALERERIRHIRQESYWRMRAMANMAPPVAVPSPPPVMSPATTPDLPTTQPAVSPAAPVADLGPTQDAAAAAQEEPAGGGHKWLVVGAIGVVVAGGTYFFFKRKPKRSSSMDGARRRRR